MTNDFDKIRSRMRRATFEILLCGLISFLLVLPFHSVLDQWLIVPSAVGVGVFFALLLVSLKWKSNEVMASVFLLAIGYLTFVIGSNHEYYVRNLDVIQPYIGLKLMILLIAWVAPPIEIVGWASFVGIGVFASFQYFTWDEAHRLRMGVQEPIVTYIVLVCGMMLYKNRLRVFELLKREVEYRTRTALLTRFAGLLICAKHLASTPIQTLEFIFANLKVRFPVSEQESKLVDQSLEKLRQIDEAMYSANLPINWDEVELPTNIEELKVHVSDLIENRPQPPA